jgi:hypothetical protein
LPRCLGIEVIMAGVLANWTRFGTSRFYDLPLSS